MESLKNPKLIAAVVLAALALIVFYQNSEQIEVQVLFLGSFSTRIATALLLAFLTGMVSGALAFSRWKSQREKSKTAASAS